MEEGPRKFYKGWLPYALNYTVNYSIQITIYEMMMRRMKEAGITQEDKMNEVAYILASSCMGGLIGSGLSNSFEVVAVQKQANADLAVMEIIQKERFRLLTKGLVPRMVYHS